MMNKKAFVIAVLLCACLCSCDDDEADYNVIRIENASDKTICVLAYEDFAIKYDDVLAKQFKSMTGRSGLVQPGQQQTIVENYVYKWTYRENRSSELRALYVAVYSPVDSIRHVSSIVANANVLADEWSPDMSDTIIHTSVEGRDVDVFLYVYPLEKLQTMPSTIQVKFDEKTIN